MPNPKKNESKDDYIKRFMGSAEAQASFPDEKQRYAVAISKWGQKEHAEQFEELLGVEIFAAGTYELGDGEVVTYTDDDVKEIADNTNKLVADGKHNPPGKLGHDGSQAFAAASGLPAIGWAENLRRVGSKLVADFRDVPALAYKALKQGLYKKISSEIYHEKASKREFGVEGKVLRAVAFLGADVPKVKGLAAFLEEQTKSGSDDAADVSVVTYDHSEEKPMAKKGDGPLMVHANRHPYGALVTGAEKNDSGLEAGKQYKVHGVHPDDTYDVHDPKDPHKEHKGVPHDDMCLMSETQSKEGDVDKIELAEKEKKDAILLAEKNASEATTAKAEVAKMKLEARDKAVAEFCEKYKTTLLPALQPKFKALVAATAEIGVVRFDEKDEKPFLDGLMVFLSELMTSKSVALGEIAPTGEEGGDMGDAEVKLAEEPFQVHLTEASRSENKPVLVHADLTVAAEEYCEKHPGLSFSQALKHVAKLEKASISVKGGAA